jgi:hypothetical protein
MRNLVNNQIDHDAVEETIQCNVSLFRRSIQLRVCVLWIFGNTIHGSLSHTNHMEIKGLGYSPHGG